MNIKVNDWVKIDRWPLAPIFGQVTAIDDRYATIINYHGEKQVRVCDIIDTIDIEAHFADDPNGLPPFVAERMRLTA